MPILQQNTCQNSKRNISNISELDSLKNEGKADATFAAESCVPQSMTFNHTNGKDVSRKNANNKGIIKRRGRRSTTCGICGLTNICDVVEHRNSHRKEGVFECSYCVKKIEDYSSFISHVKTHTGGKSFKCEICGRQFAFACSLKDHTNLHNGEKPHLCSVCGKRFAMKVTLKHHYKTHEPQRFKCRFCGIGSSFRADLLKHERTHTGERPYMCAICGEGYIQSSHLSDHARTHSGERPNKCDICGRGFYKKGDMQRHRRIHTGEFPYVCLVCGKFFRQSTQCSNHVKTHHPETLNQVQRDQSTRALAKSTSLHIDTNDLLMDTSFEPNVSCAGLLSDPVKPNCHDSGLIIPSLLNGIENYNHSLVKTVVQNSSECKSADVLPDVSVPSELMKYELLNDIDDSSNLLLPTSDLVFDDSHDLSENSQFLSNALTFLS